MWWFHGLFTMLFAFLFTVLMFVSVLLNRAQPRRHLLVRLFIVLLCVEFPLLCGAVAFIIFAENGVF